MVDTINYRFKVAGKTAATLTADNPTPLERELVVETDTGKVKIGDGATAWNSLSYLFAIGTNVQAFDADLSALAGNGTNGFWARTGAGTGAARTITGTANEVDVANGAGTAGNPTLSLPTALTFTGKTITGGTFRAVSLAANGYTAAAAASGIWAHVGVASSRGFVQSFDFTGTAYAPLDLVGSVVSFRPGGTERLTINGALGNYANDAAAAAAGVPVLGMYRNGSVLMIRVA
jgi:hypothetical protein